MRSDGARGIPKSVSHDVETRLGSMLVQLKVAALPLPQRVQDKHSSSPTVASHGVAAISSAVSPLTISVTLMQRGLGKLDPKMEMFW